MCGSLVTLRFANLDLEEPEGCSSFICHNILELAFKILRPAMMNCKDGKSLLSFINTVIKQISNVILFSTEEGFFSVIEICRSVSLKTQ